MNLTINEQLMTDTKDANLCIFIANLSTWIRTNASKQDPKQRNIHKGRCWSYNTIQDFVKYFGFWSTKNIRTIIANCIKLGLITTNTFNKKKYDHTIWYTLTDKGFSYYPQILDTVLNSVADSGKRFAKTGNAIPEKPYSLSSNINITTSEFHNSHDSSNNDFECLEDGNLSVRSDYKIYHQPTENVEPARLIESDLDNKSDYHNNQT